MNPLILVVDDDATIRLLLQAHFTGRGFACSTARDGTEAMAILGSRQIHVLVTDLEMPGMDGRELLRALRSKGLFTRAVVVTGYATIGNLTACLLEGAVALVPKPLADLTQLDRAVDQALEQLQRWTDQMSAIVRLRGPATTSDALGALEPRNKHAR